MKYILSFVFVFFLCFASLLWAAEAVGVGDVAVNLMEPVSVASQFISTGVMILGACCLFAAVLRYPQYRINPLASPLSDIILLVVIGIVLICLPLIVKLSESSQLLN